MPRVRDEQRYAECRDSLLAVGQELFINNSFNSVGLNDILKHAGIPKGSFYHYFESKEDFGLQVVEQYAKQNYAQLQEILSNDSLTPFEQLRSFFEGSIKHYQQIKYCQGCLMANLSQELADVNENLRCKINTQSRQMLELIAGCIARMEDDRLNLGHLEPMEAAQVLMNSWTGALMRMKLEKNREPLELFMKFFFRD